MDLPVLEPRPTGYTQRFSTLIKFDKFFDKYYLSDAFPTRGVVDHNYVFTGSGSESGRKRQLSRGLYNIDHVSNLTECIDMGKTVNEWESSFWSVFKIGMLKVCYDVEYMMQPIDTPLGTLAAQSSTWCLGRREGSGCSECLPALMSKKCFSLHCGNH